MTFVDAQNGDPPGHDRGRLVHEHVQPPLGRHGRGRRRPGHAAGNDRTVRVRRPRPRVRASEERFRTLVQNIRDYAIFMLDAAGYITEWTDGATRVIGHGARRSSGATSPCCIRRMTCSAARPTRCWPRPASRTRRGPRLARAQGRHALLGQRDRDRHPRRPGRGRRLHDGDPRSQRAEGAARAARAAAGRGHRGPLRGGAGEPRQGRIPHHAEPRAADAPGADPALGAGAARRLGPGARRRPRRRCDRPQRGEPAAADRGSARPVAVEVRARSAGPADQLGRGGRARGRRGDHAQRAGEGRDRRARRDARPRRGRVRSGPLPAGALEPAVERGEVHARRRACVAARPEGRRPAGDRRHRHRRRNRGLLPPPPVPALPAGPGGHTRAAPVRRTGRRTGAVPLPRRAPRRRGGGDQRRARLRRRVQGPDSLGDARRGPGATDTQTSCAAIPRRRRCWG